LKQVYNVMHGQKKTSKNKVILELSGK